MRFQGEIFNDPKYISNIHKRLDTSCSDIVTQIIQNITKYICTYTVYLYLMFVRCRQQDVSLSSGRRSRPESVDVRFGKLQGTCPASSIRRQWQGRGWHRKSKFSRTSTGCNTMCHEVTWKRSMLRLFIAKW